MTQNIKTLQTLKIVFPCSIKRD